jgi:hypothetical protein
MLSVAKHLCSCSQVLEARATAEILRFAQDDSPSIFPHLLSPLGERVDRTGVFFSRSGPGEGVVTLETIRCATGH